MNGDQDQTARPGTLLGGRYRLRAPIGAGGMAEVWEAHDEVLARTVAVKLVTADDGDRDRIRHEARAAAALSHPNIAQVHDFGERDSVPYVVMELVPGGTLLQRMHAGPVGARFAMRVCAEIAAALAAAHAAGLVHRDIKPANVMLAPTGAKVVDFGIAASAGADDDEPEVLGTPAYLAPERLIGDEVVPASDVYALGIVLYLLLAGRSPWTSEDTKQMVDAHLYVEPDPLPALPGVPAEVIDLCNWCLAKDPVLRPGAQEAAEVLARAAGRPVVTDEEPAAAGSTPAVVVPLPPQPAADVAAPEPERAGAGGPGRRWLIAAALLPVAGAGAWMLLGGPGVARDSVSAPPLVALPPVADPTAGAGASVAAAVPAGPSGPRPPAATRALAAENQTLPAYVSPTVPALTATAPAPGAPTATSATTPPGAPAATTPGTTTPPVAEPTTEPEPEPEPEPPAPVERTLTSEAGTLVATCTDPGTAQILSWTASKPYKVRTADPGPADAPTVTYKRGNQVVEMTVTCAGGVPSASLS